MAHASQRPGALAGRRPRPCRRAAFTLIELVTVMAVIVVLAALLAGGATLAVRRARLAECGSQVRQLGLAVHLYANDAGDHLPVCARLADDPVTHLPGLATVLAPTIKDPRVYRCPSDTAPDGLFATVATSYEWNALLNGSLLDHATLQVIGVQYNVPIIGDGDAFHGGLGRNYFYADGHLRNTAGSPLE